ncbi:MAG: hypothetical protein RIM84_08880 [Alphaproteobacteria bacterium]
MTGSRSRRRAFAVALTWLAAAAALPAAAQSTAPAGKPVPLFQRQTLPPPSTDPGAPKPVLPSQAVTAAPKAPARGGIQVETLDSFDRGGVGLLSGAEGGLGETMWQGSQRRMIDALVPRLPMRSPSPTQAALTRLLLLSAAAPPSPAEGETAGDLFGARLERLLAGGHVEQVLALAERGAVEPAKVGEAGARAIAEAWLLKGDDGPACAIAQVRLASAEDAYWQQLSTYCLALEGERAQVDFNIDLMREFDVQDPVYFALLPAVMGGKAKAPKNLSAPSPLHMAMMRKAGLKPPVDVLDGAGPAIWSVLALHPSADTAVRLAAAERAATVGALTPAALALIYRGVTFSAGELGKAEQAARGEPGPTTNALLYQAVLEQPEAEARAKMMQLALATAERQNRLPLLARVYLPQLREFTPTGALSWFARDAGRALLAGDELDFALTWFRTAHIAAGNRDTVALAAVLALWPLLAVADDAARVGYAEETLDTWWQVRQEEDAVDRFARAQALLAGLDVTGQPAKESALWPMAATAPSETLPAASGLLLAALDEAAEAVRSGETVLLALLALGDEGPGGRHIGTVAAAADALVRIGLGPAARGLLVEALLARGF